MLGLLYRWLEYPAHGILVGISTKKGLKKTDQTQQTVEQTHQTVNELKNEVLVVQPVNNYAANASCFFNIPSDFQLYGCAKYLL